MSLLAVCCPLPAICLIWRLHGWLAKPRRNPQHLWILLLGHSLLLAALMALLVVTVMTPIGMLLDQADVLPEKLRSFIGFAITIAAIALMRLPWRWSLGRMLRQLRQAR